jgi:radical SAM protein with 4Fe4S-binding SPASM domain
MNNWFIRTYNESNYLIAFDRDCGTFIRYGKNDINPFYNLSGPELLDISITNYCQRECDFCYRNSNKHGHFISLEDYELVMVQAEKAGVLQAALGGGNPNQHPHFIQILQLTKDHHIIPSYTTNGQGLTPEIYQATKKLCGALAVSWYEPYIEAKEVIKQAIDYGIKLNIHFLLSKNTLPQAIELLEHQHDLLSKINAIIFLNYKPVHTPESLCLSERDEIKHFLNLIKQVKKCKIGFDSCMISYLPLMGEDLAQQTVDFCEAARFSAFVSEDLFFYPCSFMKDSSEYPVNLRTQTLEDGWRNGEEFVQMRHKLNTPAEQKYAIQACRTCHVYEMCHGGCQVFNINRCRSTSMC